MSVFVRINVAVLQKYSDILRLQMFSPFTETLKYSFPDTLFRLTEFESFCKEEGQTFSF